MSLVSEALKKAEREAAARNARAQGQPPPFEPPLQPYRSRHAGGRNRALVASLALAAGAAAIAVALLLLRPEKEEKAPVKETATVATGRPAPPPSAAAAPDDALQTPAAPTPSNPASAATAPMPSASERTTPRLATPPLPRTAPRTTPPSPGVSEPAASKPTGASKPVAAPPAPARVVSQGSGDYLRSVEFADGTKLELGGIVYSEAAPFAYLNGRLVGVGEFVLGRRIDRIDRDKVILAGDTGDLILRLKAP